MIMKNLLLSLLLFASILSYSQKRKVDLLVFNATYTVNTAFTVTDAMVINKGKIVETGKLNTLQTKYEPNEKLDAGGKFIYPGFIDAHAHFVGYGNSLQRVDLVSTNSWEEVIERTKQFATEHPDGWLLGR